MYIIYAAIISALTVIYANCKLLSDFPDDIIEDWTSILINGTVKTRNQCNIGLSDPLASLIEYWIYTRNDPSTPVIVKKPNITTSASRSKIIYVSHGWTQSPDSPDIAGIKDAYLERYDAYVVSVNWAAYSMQNYFCAYLAVPAIANNIASSLCRLKQNNNIALEEIHIVGHSLGGQLFGITGELVTVKCGVKVGRITGLDPAGPLYDGIFPILRLSPDDAEFVDVIHTAVGTLGYLGSLGQLDAYANCGYSQPGCLQFPTENITEILNLPIEIIECNHARSVYYFTESIKSDKFVADECLGCGLPVCFPIVTKNSTQKIVGENNNTPGNVRNYVFYTNPSPPYAQG